MDKKTPRVCVGVIIANPKGEILLLRSPKWKDQWVVPGGGIEWGEKGEEAVKREAMEETGLRLTDITFFQAEECVFPEEFHKEQHFIFFDYTAKTQGTAVTLNEEATEFCWKTPREALHLPLNKSTRGFVEKYRKVARE